MSLQQKINLSDDMDNNFIKYAQANLLGVLDQLPTYADDEKITKSYLDVEIEENPGDPLSQKMVGLLRGHLNQDEEKVKATETQDISIFRVIYSFIENLYCPKNILAGELFITGLT